MEKQTTTQPVKPFACHGEYKPGVACKARLTQAEAWVIEATIIREAIGRWPSVKDLADHIFCGRCMALGRKTGVLRFHHYQKTVAWMERRRVERVQAARQAFGRYLPASPAGRPKDTVKTSSAVGAMPTALAEV